MGTRKTRRGSHTIGSIVAGDLNAWSTTWGSARTTNRGAAVLEMARQMNLTICNVGGRPTFERAGKTSVVDITMATDGLAKQIIRNWEVSEKENLSDNKYILFNTENHDWHKEKNLGGPTGGIGQLPSGWAIKKLNPGKFEIEIAKGIKNRTPGWDETTDTTAEKEAEALKKRITEACDAAAPKRKGPRAGKPAYWWNKKIATARRECRKTRRKLQRERRRRMHCLQNSPTTANTVRNAENEVKKARKKFRTEIKRSKEAAWKEMLKAVDDDPWGMPYKICMGKLRSKTILHAEETRAAVKKLFPPGEVDDRETKNQPGEDERTAGLRLTPPPPPITNEETKSAIKAMKDGKAPGEDQITNEVIKLAHAHDPSAFKRLYNSCLRKRTFPKSWKRANLVLLPKGKPGAEGKPGPYVY